MIHLSNILVWRNVWNKQTNNNEGSKIKHSIKCFLQWVQTFLYSLTLYAFLRKWLWFEIEYYLLFEEHFFQYANISQSTAFTLRMPSGTEGSVFFTLLNDYQLFSVIFWGFLKFIFAYHSSSKVAIQSVN